MDTDPEHHIEDVGLAIADEPSIAKRPLFQLLAMMVPLGLVGWWAALMPGEHQIPSPDRDPSGNQAGYAASHNPADSTSSLAVKGQLASLGAAAPIDFSDDMVQRNNAADCLAAAAWYESGNDETGQRAVIQTVLNRLKHPGFPKSVCGVVFQGSNRPTGCQFTFTCDGSLARRRPSPKAWQAARAAALKALDGFVDKSVGTATHYHADYVSPWWSPKLERLTSVGSHVFYRWSDRRGTLPATVQLTAERDYAELVQQSYAFANSSTIADIDRKAKGLVVAESGSPSLGNVVEQPIIGSAEFMAFEDRNTSGRWAILAMRACRDRRGCRVIGYANEDLASLNQRRMPEVRDRPLFLFIRDKASGMELALWDCDEVARASPSQCLPKGGAALASLMTER
jgi:spore germination cell wall hydrolase CwlJ-like protein